MDLLGYVVTRLDEDTRWQGRTGGVTKLFRTQELAQRDIANRTFYSKLATRQNYRIDPVYINRN